MQNPDNTNANTNDAAYRIVPILNERLKTAASDAGWPIHIVESLSVDYDGEVVYVRVPPAYEEEVDNLEYGTPYGLPNAVIGPFIARSENVIKEVLLSIALDEMTTLLAEVFVG